MKKIYENYPWWSIIISDLVPLTIYAIAGYIIYQFGLIWLIIYLVYFAILELSFYPKACVYCYYYGKWCFSGKGKIAGWFFKKKEPEEFCKRKASFVGMLPELLVVIVPIVLGIILLVKEFNLFILILIILDFILVSWGNAFVRGKLACPHCRQGQICCSARDMFNKK